MNTPELFPHQAELLDRTWQEAAWALFWEVGTGKSCPTIHTASRLFETGRIDGGIIVAPRGVHAAWITDELPRHSSVKWRGLDWHSDRGKGQDKAVARLLEPPSTKELVWLAMTFDNIATERGRKVVLAFLARFQKRLLVIDEGSRIRSATSKRTKKVAALRQLCNYVRLLNGSPIGNSALDIYAQMRVLDEYFWVRHGIGSWTAFQSRFAVMKKIVVGAEDEREPATRHTPLIPHDTDAATVEAFEQLDLDALRDEQSQQEVLDPVPPAETVITKGVGRTIEIPVGFRDLDKLREMIKPMSSRLTKEEAGLNLPPRLYNRIPFDLHPEQRRAYDTLRKEYMIELDNGLLVTAPLAITRLMRLQQIASGFLPDPENPDLPPTLLPRDAKNPRLEHLLELCEDLPQTIIWSRFTFDVDLICRELGPAKCVRYDGKVSGPDREKALARFRAGKAHFLVAKLTTMSTGLTLNEAKAQAFYTNSFSYIDRVQGEARCHRPGQHSAVTYYDFTANNTVDEKLLRTLKEAKEVADAITGDSFKEWLS